MSLEPILIFLFVRHMRKTLQVSSPDAEWHKRLTNALYGVAVLFVLQLFFFKDPGFVWIWRLLFIAMAVITYKLPQFVDARRVLSAILPLPALFIARDLIKLIDTDLYETVHSYLNLGFAIAITWGASIFFKSSKQQKALDKERKKTREEEERNKYIAAQKSQLEILVEQRTAELTNQKNELQNALDELTSTQRQLIQSEKMASLGELTAGIAHEIQNPLNFVNNFSEVNAELIEEMRSELNKGNLPEAESIANDIKENEQKIIFHGKRADAIVKGMLQHSRSSSSQKEPTDINALADEYFRLSYHGLRAKDKTFNATLRTDFDPGLRKIDIVPQDIGRVLLNLFTNSFYSVTEKKHSLDEGKLADQQMYEPTVSISTNKVPALSPGENGELEIHVKDNGVGIPQKVLDKIYQPFFTTKPTGQGTGLGLSLSYDIIRAHGGDIKVITREGEGAEFIIQLPVV